MRGQRWSNIRLSRPPLLRPLSYIPQIELSPTSRRPHRIIIYPSYYSHLSVAHFRAMATLCSFPHLVPKNLETLPVEVDEEQLVALMEARQAKLVS